MNKRNLVGQTFSRLVVLDDSGLRHSDGSILWFCRCTCGSNKTLNVTTTNLVLGRVESCGCLRRDAQAIDISSQRFGRLTAVEKTGKNSGTNIIWRCLCDCGKECLVNTSALRTGKTSSCGCLSKELTKLRSKKNNYSSSFNALYSLYKGKAKSRGIDFTIDIDSFYKLVTSNCSYCNKEPSKLKTHKKYDNVFIYNGIDRVDNDLGYVDGNCTPCCDVCNYAKRQMSVDSFKSWIKSVYEFMFK